MTDRIYHTLFLCTGNSARSILAEAILSRLGAGRFHAQSAGSHPKGAVHPLALEVLADRAYDTAGLRSKSWDEFAGPGAPALEADPAAFVGPEAEQRWLFRRTYQELERRIEPLTCLRIEALDRLSLRARLDEIGKTGTPAGEAR